MRLEELRYEDLGLIRLAIAEMGKPGVSFQVNFHYFTNLAYKNTVLSLRHLEAYNILTTEVDSSIAAISYSLSGNS
jgi:hypothetical protein